MLYRYHLFKKIQMMHLEFANLYKKKYAYNYLKKEYKRNAEFNSRKLQ